MNNGLPFYRRSLGSLALSLIPAALAMGATGWFGFYIASHNFNRELSQEERAAKYVGAETRPKSKIRIETDPGTCIDIDKVDLDGNLALIYYHNKCNSQQRFIEVHYRWKSPNGTVIKGDDEYANLNGGAESLKSREKGELQLSLKTDDRAESLSLWVTSQ